MTLTWKKTEDDRIVAEVKGYSVEIRRCREPRRSPYITVLNGEDGGFYGDLAFAQGRAEKWLHNQMAFDGISGAESETEDRS